MYRKSYDATIYEVVEVFHVIEVSDGSLVYRHGWIVHVVAVLDSKRNCYNTPPSESARFFSNFHVYYINTLYMLQR